MFYVICDAANKETEETFEEFVEEINDQDDFDIVYEVAALFDLGDDED